MRHTRCVAQLHSSSAFLGCVGEIDRALDNALRPTPRKTSPLPLLFTDDCLHMGLFSARNFQRSDDVSVAQLVAIRDTVSMPYPGDAALLIVPQTIDDGSHSIRRIASSVLEMIGRERFELGAKLFFVADIPGRRGVCVSRQQSAAAPSVKAGAARVTPTRPPAPAQS